MFKKAILAATLALFAALSQIPTSAYASQSAFVYDVGNGNVELPEEGDPFVAKLSAIADSPAGLGDGERELLLVKIGKCSSGHRGCYTTYVHGSMNVSEITLDKSADSEEATLKVFVHELGHARFFLLSEKRRESFSSISHDEKNGWRVYAGRTVRSFASGYGASSNEYYGRYEDFAEAYAMYVFHNAKFRSVASKNADMRKKYIFMKTSVFWNGGFSGTDFTEGNFPYDRYDITVIPTDMDSFFKLLTDLKN